MLQKIRKSPPRKQFISKQATNSISAALSGLYPDAASELNFKNEYQLAVAVMLSAQCTDKKVNEVTPLLFSRFPGFKELAKARSTEIERIIRPVNYYKTKARHLLETARLVTRNFAGRLPMTHEKLLELPGIGRKTANVILTELQAAHTMPVDTHVFRVSKRLGLSRGNTPLAVEEDLKGLFPPLLWRNLHHWLIFHGRRVCKAQNPLCRQCGLNALCPSRKTSP